MIDTNRSGAVQTIRINRPEKKNALDDSMYVNLRKALMDAEDDQDIAVHLLLGTEGAFTAGHDIAEFKAFADKGRLGNGVVDFLRVLPKLEKPLVAAVDGLAIGIGTTLLFHCDMVLASPQATFKTPFLDLGLIPEAASSLLIPKTIGHVRAFEMLCLGRTFSAEEALQSGIINEIVPVKDLERKAFEICEMVAKKPREAMRIARNLLRSSNREEIEARTELEIEKFAERLGSEEAQSAFDAFFNRK